MDVHITDTQIYPSKQELADFFSYTPSKHLLNPCIVPGIIPGPGDPEIGETNPSLRDSLYNGREG